MTLVTVQGRDLDEVLVRVAAAGGRVVEPRIPIPGVGWYATCAEPGGHPLVLECEHPGYVLNALIGPLLATAAVLAIDGVSTTEDVDRAWMLHRQAPMALRMMDLFGIDVVCDGFRQDKGAAELRGMRPRIAAFLSEYVASSRLGAKTGRGFYRYPGPVYAAPGFTDGAGALIAPHVALTSSVIHNAALLDLGPFGIADQMELEGVERMLEAAQGMFDAEDARRVRGQVRRRAASAAGSAPSAVAG